MLKVKEDLKSAGQSMIEVVVSITLVILTVTGLIAGVTVAVRNVQFSRSQVQAKSLSEQAMETVRSYRDQNGWNKFWQDKIVTTPSESTPVTIGNFIKTVTYQNVSGGSQDKALVRVIVTWTEGGRSHQVQSESYITKWQ